MKNAEKISILIPVGAGDESWKNLLGVLEPLRTESEFIFSAVDELNLPLHWVNQSNVKFLKSQSGRALQLNGAVKISTRPILWFLHADTSFNSNTLARLEKLIPKMGRAIYYFDLKFAGDGPKLMLINAIGVWFRSHLFKLPFGDQGFLMKRIVFDEIGPFDEAAPFGEDHLLIWEAKFNEIPIKSTGASLYTSARKYQTKGWGSTTLNHLRLTVQQAMPLGWKLIKDRFK